MNFARSSSDRGCRGLVGRKGGGGDLTCPEEKRLAGETKGEDSVEEEGMGGVDGRWAG